jgi:hypothetical protein
MCSQSYSAFCVQTLPWNGNASQPHYSLLRTGLPPRSVLDAIRRGGVPYSYGEIEHDIIAALMRTRVQIPQKRFLEKACRWAQTQTSTIWCPQFFHREDRPNSARPCARRSSALGHSRPGRTNGKSGHVRYLRGNKLAITVFNDNDDIVDKTCDAWNFFEQGSMRIPQSPPEHGQQSITRAVGIRGKTMKRAISLVVLGALFSMLQGNASAGEQSLTFNVELKFVPRSRAQPVKYLRPISNAVPSTLAR